MKPLSVLVVSATPFELKPIADKLSLSFQKGEILLNHQINNLKVDFLITGVGMVSTAYHLGKHLALNKYDIAINIGVCGAFNRDIPLGEVVLVKNDSFPEVGAESPEGFLSIFALNLAGENEHPYSKGVIKSFVELDLKCLESLKTVKAITVNTVSGVETTITARQKLYNAEVESMEGAAFMFACNSASVSGLQVRAVSNYVEPRNRENWKMQEAIASVNDWLMKLINEISSK